MTDHVVFLIVWGAAGFTALAAGVSAVEHVARRLTARAEPPVRVTNPEDALAA